MCVLSSPVPPEMTTASPGFSSDTEIFGKRSSICGKIAARSAAAVRSVSSRSARACRATLPAFVLDRGRPPAGRGAALRRRTRIGPGCRCLEIRIQPPGEHVCHHGRQAAYCRIVSQRHGDGLLWTVCPLPGFVCHPAMRTIVAATVRNAPEITFSAVIWVPSAFTLPSTRNWSPGLSSIKLLGLASEYFTESGAYRVNCVSGGGEYSHRFLTLRSAHLHRDLSRGQVDIPAKLPRVPRFCQSASSDSCFCCSSPALITMTITASSLEEPASFCPLASSLCLPQFPTPRSVAFSSDPFRRGAL